MPNLTTAKANIPLVKNSYKNLLAMGEGRNSTDFRMVVDGYQDLEFLIQSTQIPERKREVIDSKGPHGVMFKQMGNFLNAGDLTITFKEVITGKVYEVLRQWVKDKVYLDITLSLISETEDSGNSPNTWLLEDCWIELDASDLGVEDGTTLVKPSGTIHYNWVSQLDDEADNPTGWE